MIDSVQEKFILMYDIENIEEIRLRRDVHCLLLGIKGFHKEIHNILEEEKK